MARRRPYAQFCALAAALEVIGDRWTALIIRDLAVGSRRFGELAEGLRGIPEDVLAARLKLLQAEGIAERAGSHRLDGYRLTADGRALLPALGAVARWGAERLPADPDREQLQPRLALSALALGFDPEAARGLEATVRITIDDESATLDVHDGTFAPSEADAVPDVILRTDVDTAYALGRRQVTFASARRDKRLVIDGDAELAGQVMQAFRFPGRV